MMLLGNTHLPMLMGMVCVPSPPQHIGKRSPLREVGMMVHMRNLALGHTQVMVHQRIFSQGGHRGSTLVLMGGLAGTVGEDAAIADPLPTPMLGRQMLASLHSTLYSSKHLQFPLSNAVVEHRIVAAVQTLLVKLSSHGPQTTHE